MSSGYLVYCFQELSDELEGGLGLLRMQPVASVGDFAQRKAEEMALNGRLMQGEVQPRRRSAADEESGTSIGLSLSF